ncbi:MAG: ETC complex I subunit [Alphaproteobacteria bacterium]
MKARIFQPTKTAMQSGRAKTQNWVLEFEPTRRQQLDPLMGWPGAGDTMQQVRMNFESRADAEAHATRHGLDYVVQEPKERQIKPKAYADNFAVGRRIPWSH